METRDCIKSRRSIRRFTDQEISDEAMLELLKAIRWSPSWANTQTWEVVIVKDQTTREKLAEYLHPKNPSIKAVLQAPVVMAVCSKLGCAGYKQGQVETDKGDWYMFDAGIACQNLCLAAHDMGLGTVHIGHFDHKKVDELLGVPEDVKSVELIPVGYAVREGTVTPRKEMESFVFAERYGQPAKF